MLRIARALLVLGVCFSTVPVVAQESNDAQTPGDQQPEQTGAADASDSPAGKPAAEESESKPTRDATTGEPASQDQQTAAATPASSAPPPAIQTKPVEEPGWRTFGSGYFRAPFSMGFSPRPSPDDMGGPTAMQISYGPTRTVDSNYYSFAYTRLQEQDWVEVNLHAKKKHVEAVVGYMGYWLQGAGFRNYDAAWAPGIAYLKLDTDVAVGSIKPNVALTAGAFWPQFGYFEKYDTLTLGRFRHLGEQLKFTIPVNADLTLTLVQGFGTGRDGNFSIGSPPPYQATVGMDLLHYEHIQISHQKYFDVGLHFNHQWTRDPNLFKQSTVAVGYTQATKAKFTTFGLEANLRAPYAGRLWVSPSYTRVLNGWALGEAGTEVMHSMSGEGFATNYLAWTGITTYSTGTGASFNLGFLYENKLSTILGKPEGLTPEVTLNVFGLLLDATLDLPPTNNLILYDTLTQFKYGADVTVQPLTWLGIMARFDEVNYNMDHPGYVFSAITGRATFSSHFLSTESIYIQYSRYRYGDKMVLAGTWPWNTPLVAGADIVQGGPYKGHKPDMDVIKVQASVSF